MHKNPLDPNPENADTRSICPECHTGIRHSTLDWTEETPIVCPSCHLMFYPSDDGNEAA